MDLNLKDLKHDDKKEWSFLTWPTKEPKPLKWVGKPKRFRAIRVSGEWIFSAIDDLN